MANNIDREDLSELNAIFKEMGGVDKIEDYTNNFENLPDGEYVGEIENVEAKNSKNSGKPMIDIVIAVADGKKEWRHLMLAGENLKKTQSAIARTVSQLKELGVDCSSNDIAVITDNAHELIGTKVNMKIETTNNFRNVWLTLA
jgi:hypothetical protein